MNIEISQNKLILISVISLIVFIVSLDFSSFNGFSLIGIILFGIILYFGSELIFKLFQSGTSLIVLSMFVIGMIILSTLLWSFYTIYTNKKNINKKWAEYKCRPYILPFAGWAIGPSGVSSTQNFMDCMWAMNKSYFDILISPFTDILNIITDLLGNMVNDMQNMRKMITYMRSNMEEMAQDILQKIWASYERIAFLFKTILQSFTQLGIVFKDLFDVLLYEYYTFSSLINGPIGEITKFFDPK